MCEKVTVDYVFKKNVLAVQSHLNKLQSVFFPLSYDQYAITLFLYNLGWLKLHFLCSNESRAFIEIASQTCDPYSDRVTRKQTCLEVGSQIIDPNSSRSQDSTPHACMVKCDWS